MAPIKVSSRFLYRWLINALALLIVSFLFGGLVVGGPLSLIIAALVLGWVNALVRPVLFWLTLPITIVTLGLFTLALNGIMLLITSALVPGLAVAGFWAAVWAAILLSVTSSLLSMVVRTD